MDDAVSRLKVGTIRILVKANAKKTEVLGWDDARQAFRVAVAAPAQDNKANLEIVKLFSKLAGCRVKIVSGLTAKVKVLALS